MGKIISVNLRGFDITLNNQNNGYLELVYKTPTQPARTAALFEEADMPRALAEFHKHAQLLVA